MYKKELLVLLSIVILTAISTLLVELPLWVIGAFMGVSIFVGFMGLIVDNGAQRNRKLSHYLVIIGTVGGFLMAVTYAIVSRLK